MELNEREKKKKKKRKQVSTFRIMDSLLNILNIDVVRL